MRKGVNKMTLKNILIGKRNIQKKQQNLKENKPPHQDDKNGQAHTQKQKKDHSDAKEYREASIFGSVLNVIAPLKTPKTPAQTPKSSRKGGKVSRRKRTLKKNH